MGQSELYYRPSSWAGHQPRTLFFTIDNLDPYGYGPLADHPEGVLYDSAVHRWANYNDDLAVMTLKRSFNVFIPPQDSTVIVDTSSALNSAGPLTDIKHALLSDPNAVIFVQHVFNPLSPAAGDSPAGGPNTTYTHTVAVTYAAGYLAIRNADGTNFPPNSAFNVLVTQKYGTGLANDHRVAVGYWPPTQRWYIFNADLKPMIAGPQKWAIFNEDSQPMDSNTVYNAFVVQRSALWLPVLQR